MIDLDRMEEQLERALVFDAPTAAPLPQPPPLAVAPTPVVSPNAAVPRIPVAPAPETASRRHRLRPVLTPDRAAAKPSPRPMPGPLDVDGQARQVVELIELGLLDEADVAIAVHARRAAGSASLQDRLDAAAWATMRALLSGRRADALAAHGLVRSMAAEAGGPEADDLYWLQRFWLAFHWGDERERYEVLDHCRERAYRYDDLPWLGLLCLLLADTAKVEEAARAFDAALPRLDAMAGDGAWLDVATNLAEAAALLGDGARAAVVHRRLTAARNPFVVVGRGWVCKGPLDRFLALGAAVAGRWSEADEGFRSATSAARQAGAEVLLARALQQWGHSLVGRDEFRAGDCLAESASLSQRLRLTMLAPVTDKVA